ncbi:MAG TPA: DUF934 domain-containing protein [Burkholderiaceae bacterium]|nr:DUF934 domain-containing protein [Burkholderiaceae bacterium]
MNPQSAVHDTEYKRSDNAQAAHVAASGRASGGHVLAADGSWRADTWRIVREDDAEPVDGDIVPLARYVALAPAQRRRPIGAWIGPDQDPSALADFVDTLPIVAVDFPSFRDGRGYSIATLLRTRLRYAGPVRAIGDVLVDQLFSMKRVGISEFALRADQKPAVAESALRTFSEVYQRSVDQPVPLFRRRAVAEPR